MRVVLWLFVFFQATGYLTAADLLEVSIGGGHSGETSGGFVGATVMIRSYDKPAMIQMDVFADSGGVVSFVTVWGSANRAKCEVVFAGPDAWFGICEVFDRPFSSPGELVRELGMEDSQRLGMYFLAAHQNACDPLQITTLKGEDFPLRFFFEMAEWSEDQKGALEVGFQLLGPYGVPGLGENMKWFWDQNNLPKAKVSDFTKVESVPEELWEILDSERKNGLGEWLDTLANTLP